MFFLFSPYFYPVVDLLEYNGEFHVFFFLELESQCPKFFGAGDGLDLMVQSKK